MTLSLSMSPMGSRPLARWPWRISVQPEPLRGDIASAMPAAAGASVGFLQSRSRPARSTYRVSGGALKARAVGGVPGKTIDARYGPRPPGGLWSGDNEVDRVEGHRRGRFRDTRGNIALLTGAGSGIGLATAVRMAAEGAVVVGCDIDPTAVDAAGEAVPSGEFSVVDVTDATATDELVARTLADHGHIDVLGNIAGINDSFLPAHELDDAMWNRVIAVNTTAVMRLCRAVLPSMMERGSGSIVNIASIAGTGGGASGLAYTASKHAVVGITRSIAWTYRSDGIRCNAICPGGVRTNHRLPIRSSQRVRLRALARLPRARRSCRRRRRDRSPRLVAGLFGGVEPQRRDRDR